MRRLTPLGSVWLSSQTQRKSNDEMETSQRRIEEDQYDFVLHLSHSSEDIEMEEARVKDMLLRDRKMFLFYFLFVLYNVIAINVLFVFLTRIVEWRQYLSPSFFYFRCKGK